MPTRDNLGNDEKEILSSVCTCVFKDYSESESIFESHTQIYKSILWAASELPTANASCLVNGIPLNKITCAQDSPKILSSRLTSFPNLLSFV